MRSRLDLDPEPRHLLRRRVGVRATLVDPRERVDVRVVRVRGDAGHAALDVHVAEDVGGVDDHQREPRVPAQVPSHRPSAALTVIRPSVPLAPDDHAVGDRRRGRATSARRGTGRRRSSSTIAGWPSIRTSHVLEVARAARSRRPRRGRRRCGGRRATPSAGCRASSRRPPRPSSSPRRSSASSASAAAVIEPGSRGRRVGRQAPGHLLERRRRLELVLHPDQPAGEDRRQRQVRVAVDRPAPGARSSSIAGSWSTIRSAVDLLSCPQVTVVGGPGDLDQAAIRVHGRAEERHRRRHRRQQAGDPPPHQPPALAARVRRRSAFSRAAAEQREVDVHRGAEVLVDQAHEGDAAAELARHLAQGELRPDDPVGRAAAGRSGRG